MNVKLTKCLMMTSLILSFSALSADGNIPGNPEAGKAKAMVCKSCHGGGGQQGLLGYPKLAGQDEQYLVSSMNAYKNGERLGSQASIMKLQTQVLDQQDIKDLAAYYSQLKE